MRPYLAGKNKEEKTGKLDKWSLQQTLIAILLTLNSNLNMIMTMRKQTDFRNSCDLPNKTIDI